jgi:predicted SprT family Zn-dependent metalloprotease
LPFDDELIRAIGARSARTLQSYVYGLSRDFSLPSLGREITFALNPRLRTCIARYRHDQNTIEVGPSFVSDSRIRREALAHELAHAAVAAKNGDKLKVHGSEWRAYMRKIGLEPRRRIDRPGRAQPRQSKPSIARYRHRCPVCQMTRYASRPVHGWYCRNCHMAGLSGELEIRRFNNG